MNGDPTRSLQATSFTLTRNAFGHLVLTLPDGQVHDSVLPVRAFPIRAPAHDISLLDADGHELVWIDVLDQVPQPAQRLIRETLDAREFMPEIQAILGVESFSTPCAWHVRTDRGETRFVLKGDEDIRRLADHALILTDSHGIHFLIRDVSRLDRESRRILDRFK
jgi:hypothetical protein